MRELVVDAWRLCVPRMLHDLPELPAPAAQVWHLVEQRRWADVAALLHPAVELRDRDLVVTGRDAVLAHLRGHPGPRPPAEVAVRAGRLLRWVR